MKRKERKKKKGKKIEKKVNDVIEEWDGKKEKGDEISVREKWCRKIKIFSNI